jgi:hypothetical protein
VRLATHTGIGCGLLRLIPPLIGQPAAQVRGKLLAVRAGLLAAHSVLARAASWAARSTRSR